MLVSKHPSWPLGYHVRVSMLAAAKSRVGILFSTPFCVYVYVCMHMCIGMHYKNCIVLTFVNSVTIMGTWCATYVSNIEATIVHPVDLQKSH